MTLRTLHTGSVLGSGVGASVDTAGELASLLTLTVTAGTPVVVVEGSADGTTWTPQGAALVSGTPTRLYGLPRRLRASWTGAGTFTLTAETRVLYASPDDLRRTSPAGSGQGSQLASMSDAECEKHLAVASALVLSAFQSAQYSLPIYAVGEDTSGMVVDIAALRAMRSLGLNFDGPDNIIILAHDAAMKWVRQVAQEGVRPLGVIDATPAQYDGGAAIAFRPPSRR